VYGTTKGKKGKEADLVLAPKNMHSFVHATVKHGLEAGRV
jgi:hypothetical protein